MVLTPLQFAGTPDKLKLSVFKWSKPVVPPRLERMNAKSRWFVVFSVVQFAAEMLFWKAEMSIPSRRCASDSPAAVQQHDQRIGGSFPHPPQARGACADSHFFSFVPGANQLDLRAPLMRAIRAPRAYSD